MLKKISLIFSFCFCFLLSNGCNRIEENENQKIREANAKGEYIHRKQGEFNYKLEEPKQKEREKYPWEDTLIGNQLKITKEYFRCKGGAHNPILAEGSLQRTDCAGAQHHSLPLRNGKEFVYPILTELLNYIQEKTGKKVVITCGHRCPTHNSYADSTLHGRTSKHMIGAEVDFYVKGMEWVPERVVNVIMQYYKDQSAYKGKKEFEEFKRLEGEKLLSTAPWINKEVVVRLFKSNEGRDFDNQHPYPYLSLQVAYDRDLKEKVIYSWPKAFNGYLRY